MKAILAGWLLILACAGQAGVATAQEVIQAPDLKGRWVGTSDAIVLGKAPHHGDDAVSPGKARASHVEFTLTIDQEGRRLWGTIKSLRDQEAFIGVIGFDGKTILMRDTDGTVEATLVGPDTMNLIYSHKTDSSTVVAANRLLRQK